MQKVFIVAASLIIIILLGSCKPLTEPVSGLALIDYKYYKKQSHKLFTGIAITKFENGLISRTTEVKGGIPDGSFFDYGYQGELISSGKLLPLQSEELLLKRKNIKRLTVSFIKEGSYSFINVYIIGQKISDEEFDTLKLKKNITQLLRQKNIMNKTGSINELKIVKGELE